MEDISNLKRKVTLYQEVLENTKNYRQVWKDSLKDNILNQLNGLVKESGLQATVEVKESLENLEAILLSLGQMKSGIYEKLSDDVLRHLIKHNGSLVYQQLFNGKILVMITYPMIEGYGQPRPPKQVAIYRPEEIKPPFIIRHLEEFLKEVINWEDYDDDEPATGQQKIGYNLNFMQEEISD